MKEATGTVASFFPSILAIRPRERRSSASHLIFRIDRSKKAIPRMGYGFFGDPPSFVCISAFSEIIVSLGQALASDARPRRI